jgi:signal transduction histidine kinase/CheY-like chemotaxis protein
MGALSRLASDAVYRALLDTIDEGVCLIEVIFDASGQKAVDHLFLEVNSAFVRHTGLGDVVGKTARELVPNVDPFWCETFARVARTGEAARVERYEPALDRWLAVQATRVEDPEHSLVALLVRDISAGRRAEEALLALNDRLREADRRKDEFIGVLAHELRNPLAPVRLAVEILRRTAPAEPRIERVRDVIDRQVTHMSRLIDDLLDVSRIARGKLALRFERCDVALIAQQTVEDYRPSLEAAGLTLGAAVPDESIWVEGDPVRLAQMIGNLLHNAGRFTDHGGHVEVRASVDSASRTADISVSDTGCGIDPELLVRLFDPFSQARQDSARSKGGLGLGLALTKGLADLHGGDIAVRSRGEGHGTTFTLRLPLSTNEVQERAEAAPTVSSGERLRILIVEDNQDAAETLADWLVLAGHDVKVAFDGRSALTAAHGFHPHVVISDIGLPGGLDGYAVARALRSDPEFSGVRLIAVSGYANDDARRRSRAAGFDAHLAKPPDIPTLERELANARRA